MKKRTKVRITIDGKEKFTNTDQTILDVCRANDIYIPTLGCGSQLKPLGSCQICLVELPEYGLVASCTTKVADDMVIQTNNPINKKLNGISSNIDKKLILLASLKCKRSFDKFKSP